MSHVGHRQIMSTMTLGLALMGVPAPAADPQVYVDPEVRVSYDGDAVHMESPIAASPDDPDTLYAAAELLFQGRPFTASEARIYVSRNGGATWLSTPLQDLARASWDNAVTAGPDGAAYFISHALDQRGLTVYRSHDSGGTWVRSAPMPGDKAWDREYATVDATTGPYRGRVYIAGNLSGRIGVAHSSDGGASFVTVDTGQPRGTLGYDSAVEHKEGVEMMEAGPTPVVLSDGTLIVGVRKYPANRVHGPIPRGIGVLVSRDGGGTFSDYAEFAAPLTDNATQAVEDMAGGALIGAAAGFGFAAAPTGAAHQDRIYAVWVAVRTAPERRYRELELAYSDDKGATWSRPRSVGATLAGGARSRFDQAWPMLAVNRDGVVGLAWYDSRHVRTGGPGYDVYFAASLDGGLTFTPERRVSAVTSSSATGLNVAPQTTLLGRSLQVSTNYLLRPTGGDYVQMAADAAGRFHPLWNDARDGGWQLYTSTIRVGTAPDPFRPAVAADCSLTGKLELIVGENRFDAGRGEAVVQIRLFNRSSSTFQDPIIFSQTQRPDDSVTLMKATNPIFDRVWETPPISTGAAFGASATARLSLDREHPLFPGGVTNWTTWRYRIANPAGMLFSNGVDLRLETLFCAAAVKEPRSAREQR